jgi:hypothetical protein
LESSGSKTGNKTHENWRPFMKQVRVAMLSLLTMLTCCVVSPAQQNVATATVTARVPPLIQFSNVAADEGGNPLSSTVSIVFSLYGSQKDGAPLWTEMQNDVQIDATGHYSVQLGAVSPNGVPTELFATGESRWLGVRIEGRAEQTRVLLVSVPYALKAGDAATIGGLPPSAFLRAEPSTDSPGSMAAVSPEESATPAIAPAAVTGSGTTDFIPLWTSASNLGVSVISQSAGGTTPASVSVNGALNLPNKAAATAKSGVNSYPFNLVASAFDSATSAPIDQSFQWQAEPAGSGTKMPSGTLNLLFGVGKSAPSETGLQIASNGLIAFAPGQTFPGTGGGTITDVAAGAALTGGGTSGKVTLNVDTTKVPLLSARNTFTGATNIFNGKVRAVTTSGADALVGVANDGGFGVVGQSATSSGVYGYTPSPNAGTAGVFGISTGHSATYVTVRGFPFPDGQGGQWAGVWGDSANNLDQGVAAGVFGTADDGYGGAFFNNSFSYPALAGQNSSALGWGVYGQLTGPSNEGATVSLSAGVWADTSGYSGFVDGGDAAALLATADDQKAGEFFNNSPHVATLAAENDDSTSSTSLVFKTYGGTPGGECRIDVSGNLTCTGTAGGAVSVENGARKVETYSMQSAGNWFEDAGSGHLSHGAAHVDLEPVLAQTVNTGVEYHVFLTPDGDCKGLYVSAKSSGGFDVRELGGGASSISFEYRIMAKRKGYENVRLVDVTGRLKQEAEGREKMRHSANARPQLRPSAPLQLRPGQAGTGIPQMHVPAMAVQRNQP